MEDFEGIDHARDLVNILNYRERRGDAKGDARGREDLIRNLVSLNYSEKEMVAIAQITIAEVHQIRAELGL